MNSEDSRKTWEPDGSSTSDRKTYAIVGVGTMRVKIGSANDIMRRGADLQVGSPVELVLVATKPFNIERRMHDALSAFWCHGEWFKLTSEVIREIELRMDATSYSFATNLPCVRGRRGASDECVEPSCRTIAHDALGLDTFGPFGGVLRPVSTKEDVLRTMTDGQRQWIASALKRIANDVPDQPEQSKPRAVRKPSARIMRAYEEMLERRKAANR